MNEIKLQRDGLDESMDSLEVGDMIEVRATLKVTSKDDSQIVAAVESIEEDGMPSEMESEDEGEEMDEYDQEEEAPMRKKHGKGLGILIMMGGPKGKSK
jgi:hypothetical protein